MRQLNLNRVLEIEQHFKVAEVTKSLARRLLENNYLTPGEFLQSLTEDQLEEILLLIDKNNDDSMVNFILMTEMLCQA